MRLRTLLWSGLLVSVSAAAEPGYYRHPAIHGETVAFTAEGDLWTVSARGGRATRLTTHPAEESQAAFSPDGSQIAFVASYEGVADVYAMPVAGGVPKRLSVDLGSVFVHGYAPDGRLAYSTEAVAGHGRQRRIRLVDPSTLVTEELPLADANEVAFDGQGRIVFSRFGLQVTGDNARDYRGGAMGQLWSWSLGSQGEATRIASAHAANLGQPFFADGHLYAVSDVSGSAGLVRIEQDQVTPVLAHAGWDLRQPAQHSGRVVYQLGADLRLWDLHSGKDEILSIELGSDFLQSRLRRVPRPLRYLDGLAPAFPGERVVVVARGGIAVAGVGPARRQELALPEGARATAALLSHSGTDVYAILEQGGGSEIWRLALDGSSRQQLTKGDGARRWHLRLSPDGRWLAHDDQRRRLWLTRIEDGSTREVDRGEHGGDDIYAHIVWSGDSRYLALARPNSALSRTQIVLLDTSNDQKAVLSTDRFESFAPAFSPDGLWLYFLSARSFVETNSSVWADRDTGAVFDRRVRAYALQLVPGTVFPFAPRHELSPAPPKADAEPVQRVGSIEFSGLAERLYPLPLAAGNYSALAVGKQHVFVLDRDSAPRAKAVLRSVAISAIDPKVEAFTADVEAFGLSPDAKKLFFARSASDDARIGSMYFVDAGAKAPDDPSKSEVRLGDWQIAVDPRREWVTMFDDAWRMHRQFAFDGRMRGVDWDAVYARFRPLADRLRDRAELSDLLAQMSAEFGALHSQIRPGEVRTATDAPKPARLGAEFAAVPEGLKITRIYRTDAELPEDRGPLQQAGVDVREGDVITAVNSRPVRQEAELAQLLANQATLQVLLDLQRDGKPLRQVVVPVALEREAALRYSDWLESQRRRIAARDPRIGYVHLRAMGSADMAGFVRDYFANFDQHGLIIDVRRNRGGNIDSWVIEKLLRRRFAYWQKPGETPNWNMQQAFAGHLVVLADALTYSDGETFVAGIKALGLGPVIGVRTAGAGVWLSDRNALVDGGMARVPEYPQFDREGRWLIEGRGIAPDIEVENLPYAAGSGGDPQLEAALDYLQRKLEEQPVAAPSSQAIPERKQNAADQARAL